MDDLEMMVQNVSSSRDSLPRNGFCSSTAFTQAIRDKDFDMVKRLLESDLNVTGCALLHAIQQKSSTAVRIICEHLQNSEPFIKLKLNAFADEDGFPRYTTPLLYASTENQIDIVKKLIDFGAEFPCVEAMVSRAGLEQYDRSLARLHYCRAISSEAYLLATPDPLESAFEAGRKMKSFQRIRMASLGKEYLAIKNNLDMFLSNILNKVDGIEESRLLVCSGPNGKQTNRVLPKRVEEAIELEYKQFIGNTNYQQCFKEKWYCGIIDWQHMSRFAFMLCTMMVMVFNPVLSLLYILIPFDFVQNNIRTPYMRYLLNVISKVEFIFILIYYTVGLEYGEERLLTAEHRARNPGYIAVILYFMIAGMTMREINEAWWSGPRSYFSDWFNWVDICQLILYWISISLDIYDIVTNKIIISQREDNFTLIIPERVDNIDDLDVDWHEIDAILTSESAFAIANVLTFLAILHDVVILSFVGPLLVSFLGMFADIGRFLLIFLFVWISFGIGLRQLYQTLGFIEDKYCIDCETLPFATFKGTMQVLFWSMFDLTDLYYFRQYKNLFATETVGVLLYACYLLMVSIVLINALIAMMNSTYNKVEENSDVEWKLSRTRTMASYMSNGQTLAPPFNLIPTVKTIISMLASLYFKICGHNHISKTRKSNIRKTQDNGFDTEINEQRDSYQVLIRQVTERYIDELGITTCTKEDYDHHDDDQVKSELVELKESIDLMREEMKQVQRETSNAFNQLCRLIINAESIRMNTATDGVPIERPKFTLIDRSKDTPIAENAVVNDDQISCRWQ